MADGSGFRIEAPVTVEPWRQMLRDGADNIELYGWWQARPGADCNDTDGGCAYTSMPQCDETEEAAIRLARFLKFEGSDEEAAFFVFNWNDTPGRTAAEVCAALRACAAQ